MTMRFFFLLLALMALGGSRNSQAQNAGIAVLTWTAPGDDELVGTASEYDLRYSLEPINEENFHLAIRVPMSIRPRSSGSAENFTMSGLLPNFDYYFAVRTVDDAGNWSKVSNLAFRPARNIMLEDFAQPFSLSTAWPNPARDRAKFSLTTPVIGDPRVDVFDTQGRRINTIAGGQRRAGRVEVWWNLDDYYGNPVRPGIYMVRARFGNEEIFRRVTVVQ
jgi:hypothetical protein